MSDANPDSVAVLRECPFCGSAPPIVEVYPLQNPIVWCRQCGMQTQAQASADKAIAAWNRRHPAPGGVGDAVTEALKWALPLAERAVEEHRLLRLRCGHSDLTGTYRDGTTWVGIHQSEVDEIEHAREALRAALAARTGKGEA